MIIDGTNLILGRLASVVARKALLGDKIDIVNCEKVVVSGRKRLTLEKFKGKKDRGAPLIGPYYLAEPHMIVKRAIRGMLPYKQEKGKVAFDRIRCHRGVPDRFKGEKAETVPVADVSKLPNFQYVTVMDISRFLGSK